MGGGINRRVTPQQVRGMRNTMLTLRSLSMLIASIIALATPASIGNATATVTGSTPTYTIFTGPIKGTYQRIATDIATSCPHLNIQIVPSSGSVDNINLLVQPPVVSSGWRFALVQDDVLTTVSATPDMGKLLVRVSPLYTETIIVVAAKDKKLTAFGKLIGRKVVVGSVGSGTYFTSKQLSALLNIPWADQEVSQDEGVIRVLAGQADAAIIIGGTPVPLLQEMGSYVSDFLSVVTLPDHPSITSRYPTQIIPANTYQWLKHPTVANTVDSSLIRAADVPLTVSDALVSCIVTNKSVLIEHGHPKWKEIFSNIQPRHQK